MNGRGFGVLNRDLSRIESFGFVFRVDLERLDDFVLLADLHLHVDVLDIEHHVLSDLRRRKFESEGSKLLVEDYLLLPIAGNVQQVFLEQLQSAFGLEIFEDFYIDCDEKKIPSAENYRGRPQRLFRTESGEVAQGKVHLDYG